MAAKRSNEWKTNRVMGMEGPVKLAVGTVVRDCEEQSSVFKSADQTQTAWLNEKKNHMDQDSNGCGV